MGRDLMLVVLGVRGLIGGGYTLAAGFHTQRKSVPNASRCSILSTQQFRHLIPISASTRSNHFSLSEDEKPCRLIFFLPVTRPLQHPVSLSSDLPICSGQVLQQNSRPFTIFPNSVIDSNVQHLTDIGTRKSLIAYRSFSFHTTYCDFNTGFDANSPRTLPFCINSYRHHSPHSQRALKFASHRIDLDLSMSSLFRS